MLAGKQCCFGEPEHWTQMKPGGRVQVRGGGAKLDTSIIRSALKGEREEGGKEAACVVESPVLYW